MLANDSARTKYIRELFAQHDTLLDAIDQLIHKHDLPIHIQREEGKLLQLLFTAIGAKRIVEIGTLAGYSTIWLARALPEDGIIYTIEHDSQRAALAQQSFSAYEHNKKIRLLEGDAKVMLRELDGPFDAVFIDADKISYALYLDWAEQNIRKGGLIIGDNTLLGGAVYDPDITKPRPTTIKTMQEFNKRLSNPEKYLSILLSTKDGLTIALKLY